MLRRRLILLLSVASFVACVRVSRPVTIPVSVTPTEAPSARAEMEVPQGWTALAPSRARAEFVGPDRRSRIYVRAMPALPKFKSCSKLANDYAKDVIESWGGPPRTKVAHRAEVEDAVEFELVRTDPKPAGERIWSRVLCRNGVLAVASCAGPRPHEVELQTICKGVLASLRVHLIASP